jgi:hypothetical protein
MVGCVGWSDGVMEEWRNGGMEGWRNGALNLPGLQWLLCRRPLRFGMEEYLPDRDEGAGMVSLKIMVSEVVSLLFVRYVSIQNAH